ncbi:MAG: PKD domain-containing protein, partial [Thermoplasmatota archaeon]
MTRSSTIIVDINGTGDYTRIQDAVDNASNGDTILIKQGTYIENIRAERSLSFDSFGPLPPTIMNDNYGESTFWVQAFGSVRFSNLTLMNPQRYHRSHVVECSTSNDLVIENCRILDGYSGLDIWGKRVRIENNVFSDLSYGLDVKGGSFIDISNNSFSQLEFGIHCQVDGSPFQEMRITHCDFSDIMETAIDIHDSTSEQFYEYLNISRISVDGCGASGIHLHQSWANLVVSEVEINNTCLQGEGAAVILYSRQGSESTRVRNCHISGSKVGMYLNGDEDNYDARVLLNEIDSGGTGILFGGSSYQVTDNRVHNNEKGIVFGGHNNRIYRNNFTDNDVQVVPGDLSNYLFYTYPAGGNYWSDYTGADRKSGINQNQEGSDGFGDEPYRITPSLADNYPIIKDEERPHADAGEDRIIDEGTEITLSANRSTDDNLIMEYRWDYRMDGLSRTKKVKEFDLLFDRPGKFLFDLEVKDFAGNSDRDNQTITVLDVREPVIVHQGDLAIDERNTAHFSAFGTSDTGVIDRYQWTFNYYGSEKILSGMNASFHFERPGRFNVTLKVWDNAGNSNETSFKVVVTDKTIPTADAGEDAVIENGETFTFDGGKSTDNGVIGSYTWDLTYRDQKVRLEGMTASHTFVTPGYYSVSLTVTDEFGNSDKDILELTVEDTLPPKAVISGSLTVLEGERLSLHGLDSTDNGRIMAHTWYFRDMEDMVVEGPYLNHSFDRKGKINVSLWVEDEWGNQDSLDV